jgi:DNA-binding helix-hairpin-helix protein with protein kinase domain
MSNSKYTQQYCEKHNQYYGDHLHRCPICWGEELGQIPIAHIDLTEEKIMEDKGV